MSKVPEGVKPEAWKNATPAEKRFLTHGSIDSNAWHKWFKEKYGAAALKKVLTKAAAIEKDHPRKKRKTTIKEAAIHYHYKH
jgi:hypothetical protein